MRASGKWRRSARMAGVVNTTSPTSRRRMIRIFIGWRGVVRSPRALGLDGGLVDQHHRDVVLDRIHAMTLRAFQPGVLVDERQGLVTLRADEQLQQRGIDCHRAVLLFPGHYTR